MRSHHRAILNWNNMKNNAIPAENRVKTPTINVEPEPIVTSTTTETTTIPENIIIENNVIIETPVVEEKQLEPIIEEPIVEELIINEEPIVPIVEEPKVELNNLVSPNRLPSFTKKKK